MTLIMSKNTDLIWILASNSTQEFVFRFVVMINQEEYLILKIPLGSIPTFEQSQMDFHKTFYVHFPELALVTVKH